MITRLLPWALFLVAGSLRFAVPAARPLHHDEGSNFIFLLRLIREGTWDYDPANYHGPILYYLGAIPLRLLGMSEATFRMVPALIGSLMAPLVWGLRDRIGRAGAATAGLLVAVSPCLVYYSRSQIHEIHLAFFSLCMAVSVSRALTRGGAAGEAGPCPGWWILAGLAGGAMLATKETAMASVGAIAVAGVAWGHGLPARPRPRDLGGAVLACAGVVLLFYTDFFRDPAALAAIPEGVRAWSGRGLSGEGHDKPWWYFVALLAREEAWTIGLGTIGIVLAVGRRHAFAIGLGAWAGLTLGVYSLVPYKTPWLALNPLLPILLIAGFGFDAVWRASSPAGRCAMAAVLAVIVPVGAVRAWDRAVLRPDVDGVSGLVYVQTDREAIRLIERVGEYAAARPEGRALPIAILSPDYLPLNWYLRDFPAVAYWGRMIDDPDDPVVIAREDQADLLALRLGPAYSRSTWRLRPGVRLVLFLRDPPAGAGSRRDSCPGGPARLESTAEARCDGCRSAIAPPVHRRRGERPAVDDPAAGQGDGRYLQGDSRRGRDGGESVRPAARQSRTGTGSRDPGGGAASVREGQACHRSDPLLRLSRQRSRDRPDRLPLSVQQRDRLPVLEVR